MLRTNLALLVIGVLTLTGPAMAQESPAAPHSPAAVSSPTAPDGDSPRIVLEPETFDFGTVWSGMPAEGEFKIRNTGTAPLTLTARSSCGCTVASKPKSPLAPGESTTFTINYRTTTTGKANKRVTLVTNDPDHPTIAIPVKGEVKWLFKPSQQRVSLRELDKDDEITETVVLENQAEQPVNLKLRELQGSAAFRAELKAVEDGQRYELVIHTKPPLEEGFNATRAIITTDFPGVGQFEIPVTAHVPPRLAVVPQRVHVRESGRATNQLLSVTYRTTDPVKITNIEVEPEGIETEMLPTPAPRPGSKIASHRIRLRLPAWDSLPAQGGRIVIHTDSKDPELAQLEVPIVRSGVRPRGAAPRVSMPGGMRPTSPAAPQPKVGVGDVVIRRPSAPTAVNKRSAAVPETPAESPPPQAVELRPAKRTDEPANEPAPPADPAASDDQPSDDE